MSRKFEANFAELNGAKIRNELGATRALKSYHNKHRDKSGNFGLCVVFRLEGLIDVGCGMQTQNRDVFEIHGDYATDGTLYNLSFGEVGRCSSPIPEGYNYSQIIVFMNQYIRQYQDAKKAGKL
jgi:hypothetical protein